MRARSFRVARHPRAVLGLEALVSLLLLDRPAAG
jgi:hypothetical protein